MTKLSRCREEREALRGALTDMTVDRDKWRKRAEACEVEQIPPPPPVTGRKGDSVGGQFTYDFTLNDQQRQIDLMKAAGCTWIRIDFASSVAQPRALAQRAHAQGVKVLGTIMPRGAKTPMEGAAIAMNEAPFMDAMEVGNEFNLWSQYAASPEAYAALYNACKGGAAQVSNIPVLSSGMSPGPNVTGDTDPREFLDRALASGMKPTAVAFHPYCQPALPSQDYDWSTWTKMKRWMAQHPEFTIWITEVGAFTGTAKNAVSETKQAQFIAEVFTEAKKLGIVTPIFVYQGRDGGDDDANDQHRYGVLRRNFSTKPGYGALAAA